MTNTLARHNLLYSGLVIGLLWGVWHGLSDFWGRCAALEEMWLPMFLVFAASVTAYRILMTWVYENTRSVLVAQIMHAFYTGSLAVLGRVLAPEEGLLWMGTLAAMLWAVVDVLAVAYRQRTARRAVRHQDNPGWRNNSKPGGLRSHSLPLRPGVNSATGRSGLGSGSRQLLKLGGRAVVLAEHYDSGIIIFPAP